MHPCVSYFCIFQFSSHMNRCFHFICWLASYFNLEVFYLIVVLQGIITEGMITMGTQSNLKYAENSI